MSALAVGDPATVPAAENYFTRGDQSQSQHQDGLPLGTVGGIGVRHYFPLDGEYQFQVGLVRTNTEGIRGLEHPHQLEITVDGERVFLGTVGGDAEKGRPGPGDRSLGRHRRAAARARSSEGWRAAGGSGVDPQDRLRGRTGCGRSCAATAGTYDATGRPHVKFLTVAGPSNPTGPGDTASRRRVFSCKPTTRRE